MHCYFSMGEGWALRSGWEYQPRSCPWLSVAVLWLWKMPELVRSEMCPTPREMLVTAHCASGKLKRCPLEPLFIGSPKKFSLVISTFLSQPQYRSIITVIFKSPITMVPFHSGYKLGTNQNDPRLSWGDGLSLFPHCGQATGVPGMISAVPTLALWEVLLQSMDTSHNSLYKSHLVSPRREKGNVPPHL